MTRGRGSYSPRTSYREYRGSSRGHGGSYGSPRGSSSCDYQSKYSSNHRYSNSRPKFDDFRKPFRSESYASRDRSPDRKRPRIEGYSSRHDSYGDSASLGGHYESSFSELKSFSGDRSMSYPRREEFRRPSSSPWGGYRGRGGSRGLRIVRARERMHPRRRLIESSYGIRKRMTSTRAFDNSRRHRISKLRRAIATRHSNKSDDEGSDIAEDDKKDSVEEEAEEQVDDNDKSTKEEEDSKDEEKGNRHSGFSKKIIIKLNCSHCNVRCFTFHRYERHLNSKTHMLSMKKVAMKQKAILSQMRQAQRSTQNELENSSTEDLQGRTSFCPLCKLNYRQKKFVHQSSEAHRNMKKFLMPFCKVCRVTCKSPIIFENHCCSIGHLKRKQRMETEASDHSNEDADLENFTTIDSVGDVDGEENEKEGKTKVRDTIVNVGIEKIRKVEAHYCDLCTMYLPKVEEAEMPKILAKHCKTFVHMKRYLRYKEDKVLEKRAQKLQKKKTTKKEEKDKSVKDEEVDDKKVDMEVTEENKENDTLSKSVHAEETKDNNLWAQVDKDLGDILADAEDDDEEDSSAQTKERYDRFKLSEKNGEENLKGEKDGEAISNGQVDEKEES